MNNEQQSDNPVRLPLWKNALDEMRTDGIAYGKTYPAEWFEERLRCKRNEMQFGLAISNIRRELEKDGFYLSGRGMKGNQWVILAPSSNQNVMRLYGAQALDALKRGVILGTNTRLDTLTAEEKRRHEAILEKMAVRLALVSHSAAVRKTIGDEAMKKLT